MSAGFLGMCLLGDLRQHTLAFLGINSVAWLGYGISVVWALRRSQGVAPRSRVGLIVIGFALLFRVALVATTPPTLSDDVYRYIWDGRVSNAGTSPYAHAVDSPDLDWLESSLRGKVNHAWMASPYLPTAQALFSVVYRLAPESPLAFQLAIDIWHSICNVEGVKDVGLEVVDCLWADQINGLLRAGVDG